jgi:ADP-ribose pyrophosphatase YjhB (NUDIX family)
MSTPAPTQVAARRSLAERVKMRLAHLSFLTYRAMTLGVRGLVIDADRRVLLVRHGYVAGWYLPGGGVEHGETFEAALRRELEEEACVVIEGAPRLFGLYFNGHVSKRDHVALYVIDRFRVIGERKPDHEIQEARFFPLDALPEGTTRGTRVRLAEVFEGATPTGWW